MKKFTTAALMGMMAVSGLASATDARQSGIGAASVFVKDSNDVFSLPSQLAGEGNAIYGEFGKASVDANNASTSVDQLPNRAWGGATMKAGDGVVGIWGNRAADELTTVYSIDMHYDYGASASLNQIFQTVDFASSPSIPPSLGDTMPSMIHRIVGPGSRVEVQYALPVNDGMTIGFGVNRASSGFRRENENNNSNEHTYYSSSNWGFNGGVGFKNVGMFDSLDLGARFTTEKINLNETTVTNLQFLDAANGIDARISGTLLSSKNMHDVLDLRLSSQTSNSSATLPGWGDTIESDSSDFSLGYARVLSSENSNGVFGLMVQNQDRVSSGLWGGGQQYRRTNLIALAAVAGGETKLKEWLTARAGIGANLYSRQYYDDNGMTIGASIVNSNSSGAKLSTGLTINLGNLTVDGSLNQNLVYTGGFLVSGVPNSLFSQVSATYSFGNGGEEAPAEKAKPAAKAAKAKK